MKKLNEYNKRKLLVMVPCSETLNWYHQIPNIPKPNYGAVFRTGKNSINKFFAN